MQHSSGKGTHGPMSAEDAKVPAGTQAAVISPSGMVHALYWVIERGTKNNSLAPSVNPCLAATCCF